MCSAAANRHMRAANVRRQIVFCVAYDSNLLVETISQTGFQRIDKDARLVHFKQTSRVGPALAVTQTLANAPENLDLPPDASQTPVMAHIYMLFDFGADEEKLQQANHKLQSWKQAFRLDKKLQFKFDRGAGGGGNAEAPEEEKGNAKGKPKGKAAKSSQSAAEVNGRVKLLVRLYFSPHEKLSEQRWVGRIPAEEPFKSAGPRVIHEGQPQFEDVLKQFDSLD